MWELPRIWRSNKWRDKDNTEVWGVLAPGEDNFHVQTKLLNPEGRDRRASSKSKLMILDFID